jgi:hypothetical protein
MPDISFFSFAIISRRHISLRADAAIAAIELAALADSFIIRHFTPLRRAIIASFQR